MADKEVCAEEQIKPQIDLSGAVELAERLFGIKVDDAKELNGYDDKNYYLKVSQPPENEFITDLWPHGYVLKIMNSSDSKKLDIVEAQGKVMRHLDSHGICTPQPQKNKHGKYYCLEQIQGDGKENTTSKEHVIRLLSFQVGTLMKDIPWSFTLHYKVGKFTAHLDLVLKDFFHPALKQGSSLWLLKNAQHVKDYLIFVVNDDDRSIVKQVIEDFEQTVLTNYDSLKTGVIHDDINDQNLLCQQDSEGEWHISAVLDLGDSNISPYVLELAITMTYMILQSGNVESGRHVVAGYCSLHPLPLHELRLLKVCVCTRLCQSLVLGLYSHALCPTNDYVLTTQELGWQLLHSLWAWDSTLLENMWLELPITNI